MGQPLQPSGHRDHLGRYNVSGDWPTGTTPVDEPAGPRLSHPRVEGFGQSARLCL